MLPGGPIINETLISSFMPNLPTQFILALFTKIDFPVTRGGCSIFVLQFVNNVKHFSS